MRVFSSIGLIPGIPVVLCTAGLLFNACVNDIDTIQKVTHDPKAPDEVTQNLEVLYNDSGYAQIKIFASLAETYSKPEHVTKLKNGLKVDFFDAKGEVTSSLTANYGEINYSTGKVYVSDSVMLHNYQKKQHLQTEELHWNQKDSTIYTEKHVIVTTDGKGVTGRGRGLHTTQSFDKYTIKEPVGKIDTDQ
jgi:LPS export ABC transporter protein LptC